MLSKIIAFFELDFWDPIANIFTVIGAISMIFAVFRYLYNNRIKEWKGNITINDYSADYDIESLAQRVIYSDVWDKESSYAGIIVFQPVDCVIRKLKVIQLNSDGKEIKTIQTLKNLTPESPVCFKIERAELIPVYRLRWYIDFGEYYNYDFTENCRNGVNSINGTVYNTNLFTRIRKALGLR